MNSDQDGTEGAYLSSVKADGSGFNWERVAVKDAAAGSPEHSKSSPTVGLDGTIYVGSDDDHLYAINPGDGSVKWRMDLGGDVRSSPTIGVDGTVYVGSDDNKVFAISQFAEPRNIRNLYITSTGTIPNVAVGGEIVDVNDADDWLAGDGLKPWAIRIEVMRSLDQNASGNYEYTLHTWVRQCAQIDCSDVFDTFFQDVRIEYRAKPPHLEQSIELVQADHDLFDRFLFGFTGATGESTSQNAIFGNITWLPIGTNDAIITTDPLWP